ncbi:MAG TPA: nuclear transport factor 2 family protein [Sphingomonas sp.]
MLSFSDEQTLSHMVVGYACALDARDWTAYRALFTDTIELDYGSIGSIVGPILADAWTTRCGALGGFDATLHRIANLRCVAQGEDRAAVHSYVDALHFITVDGEVLLAHLAGRYTHGFVRDADGRWKIASCALGVAGYPNGQDNFVRAFAAARARHAGDQP